MPGLSMLKQRPLQQTGSMPGLSMLKHRPLHQPSCPCASQLCGVCSAERAHTALLRYEAPPHHEGHEGGGT